METLRHVWVQCFQQVEGEVRNRDPKDRPKGAMRLVTPYDTEARGSIKQDLHWNGYKVHFTETCEPDAPNLITNVVTTTATVPDDRMTTVIHAALADRSMLPAEHWVDTGYANAGAMADARAHGVALHGPLKSVTNVQARAGAYGQDGFTVDWDSKRVTCPNGTINTDGERTGPNRACPSSVHSFPHGTVGRVLSYATACRTSGRRAGPSACGHSRHTANSSRPAHSSRPTSGKNATRSGLGSKEPFHKACTAATCADPATEA